MKQHITPEDLSALNESQKANLRDLWIPEVNSLAMARICKDVINDEYDLIVFVVGEILIEEDRGKMILRKYKLLDESFFEQNEELLENEEPLEKEEEFEFEYSEPEQYFNKVDCLPILDIGRLIWLLNQLKYGQDGFDISIPPNKRLIGDKGCTVINRNDYEIEEDELCDALWKALVECL